MKAKVYVEANIVWADFCLLKCCDFVLFILSKKDFEHLFRNKQNKTKRKVHCD